MDKKISELAAASAIDAADVSVLVHNTTDYQYTFATLLTFLGANLQLGAGISFGTVLPQNTTGKNGDVFINTADGSFAQKVSGTWMVVYTLPTTGSQADGTVLYGLGAPANSTGNNNDTYINTANGIFYKKTAGAWSLVFTMLNGPAGAKGDKGDKGDTGAGGRTILSGSANPSNTADGANGDYFINTSTYVLFGPKTAGVWGSGTSLVGPDGAKGDTGNTGTAGPAGAGVAAGGTTGQVLKKVSGSDFDTGWDNQQDITGKANIAYVDAADATLLAMLSSKMDNAGGVFTGDVGINGSLNIGGHGITANNIDLTGYLNAEILNITGGLTADTLGIRTATFNDPDGQAVNIPNEGFIGFGGHSGNPWYLGNSSADGGLEVSTSGQPAFIFKNDGIISRNTGGEVVWSDELPAGGGIGGLGTPGYLSKWTGAATLADSQLFEGTAFIGLGYTTNPAAGNKLAVNGNGYFNGNLQASGNIGANTTPLAIFHTNTTDGTGTGFLMTGYAQNHLSPADANNGVAIALINNSAGNRQFYIGASDSKLGFRFLNYGGISYLDGADINTTDTLEVPLVMQQNGGFVGIGTSLAVTPAYLFSVGASSQFGVDADGNVTANGHISTPHLILPDEDTGLTYKLNVKSGALNLVLA